MIIVRIVGGLGNQMFQYALYRKFLAEGKDAKTDITAFAAEEVRGGRIHNGYELSRIFNVVENLADEAEILKVSKDKTDLFSRVLRKVGIIKTHHIRDNYRNVETLFSPDVLKVKKGYLDGYWADFKYSESIEDILRKDFEFKLPLNVLNRKIADEIADTESVGIHVRRGDYVALENIYNNLGAEYYNEAIGIIKSKIKNPSFFCFSNDIGWCKRNLNCEGIKYVDFNKGEESYNDMRLMSLCKHNIVANSTFSIWAAWLNKNPNKTVVCPAKYYNDSSFVRCSYPDGWKQI